MSLRGAEALEGLSDKVPSMFSGLCLLAFLLPLVGGETVSIASRVYDVADLRIDNARMEVTELPEYAAVLFNFSVHTYDGQRRRPLVGIRKSDLTIKFADENRALDPTESSYDIMMVESRAQLRYVAILLDMSDSMFKNEGRARTMRDVAIALVDTLIEANLPGVVTAVYAFADVDSLRLVCDYTSDQSKVKLAIESELAMSYDERVSRYGMATSLLMSMLGTLEAVEETLKASPARTALADVFVISDGNDDTRVTTPEAFNVRLGRTLQSWTQTGLDIHLHPVAMSGLASETVYGKLQLSAEVIDGSSALVAGQTFERIITGIAQNTPASYSVVVCDTARDTAPRQRRDVLLQGHRILSYDFNPTGFRRQGAARCDAAALLAKLVQPYSASSVRDSSGSRSIFGIHLVNDRYDL